MLRPDIGPDITVPGPPDPHFPDYYDTVFVVLLRDFFLDGELWMEAGNVGEATLFPDGVKITDGTTIVDEHPVEGVDFRYLREPR
jgi:hypothetical protein